MEQTNYAEAVNILAVPAKLLVQIVLYVDLIEV
jgi:hypothetical protein